MGAAAILDSSTLCGSRVFYIYKDTSLATLMIVLKPTCNHLMHCTCLEEEEETTLLHTAVLEILF